MFAIASVAVSAFYQASPVRPDARRRTLRTPEAVHQCSGAPANSTHFPPVTNQAPEHFMNYVRLAACCATLSIFACAHPQPQSSTSSPEPTSQENRIDFTRQLREQLSLTPAEVKSLQFFLSKPITLQRELSSGDRSVSHGKLVTKDGKYIEEVDVLDGTPGVAVDVNPDGNTIDVSFESGTKLKFTGLSYTLMADTWGGKDGSGKITFDGRVYDAIDHSYLAHLSIDRQALSKLETNRRVLKGVRVDTMTKQPPVDR